MSSAANTFFVISTMAIAVPTGIKIFNWLATMWGGKIEFKTPMLFCIAFLFQFLVAGLTGIMLGSAPFNWQLGNSYFVVAHFHYVIVGGILFTIFGAFYYWFPKITGRMYSERRARIHFWLFVIGFHLTFDFMHIPGLLGMPRRIYTYEPGRGWDVWNLIVTIGVFFQAAAVLVFVLNLVTSWLSGEEAANDPWDAWTLEWLTLSPPPVYNFADVPTALGKHSGITGAEEDFGIISRAISEIRASSNDPIEVMDTRYLVLPTSPPQVWDVYHGHANFSFLPREWRLRFLMNTRDRLGRSGWLIIHRASEPEWLEDFQSAYVTTQELDFGTYHVLHFSPRK